jgi:hypothetical protein
MGVFLSIFLLSLFGRLGRTGRTTTAEVMCREFVKRSLTAPSTASFDDDGTGRDVPGEPGRYTVAAAVDSQNGFGANIRTFYFCDIKGAGNDKWTLNNLVFTESRAQALHLAAQVAAKQK